ncbi:MAG: Rpn family recombination-promoting nuclease/putative transposase [Treponema sp.]|nr:Rpn family recombination-promoting nuclease/putative transposase [Treponema sp.]
MAKIRFEEDDELIDIRFDNVFKAVFTRDTPLSNAALSKLISAFIGREVLVAGINVNEPPIDNLRDRQIRFDISCRTDKGELVNVEMCLNPDTFEPVRLEFYAGKLFTGQDIRGTGKTYNDLKEAYQITILARERFFPDDEFLHTFEYYDKVYGVSLNGKSRIITLELSKLDEVVEKPTVKMSVQEQWAVFFRYLTDKKRRYIINEIVEREEGIAMASEVLITISKDEIEQAWLLSEYKYELDTQSRLVHAEREGIKKGEQKGKLEGKQEIINLLKSGKSPEEIIRDHENGMSSGD